MPILETNILGSKIEIYYQENEKDKLIQLIYKFNERINEFKKLKDKYSDNKIIFLAALKAEDDILELKKKIDNSSKKISDQKSNYENYTKEIIFFKDKINELQKENKSLFDQNIDNAKQTKILNEKLLKIINKIIDTSDDS